MLELKCKCKLIWTFSEMSNVVDKNLRINVG